MNAAGTSAGVEHARFERRRGGTRSPWWGKAWQSAVEESSFAEADLLAGRKIARSGRVGRISVRPGEFLAAVEVGDDVFTVQGIVEMLAQDGATALVEVVAAQAGRVGALLAGDLPGDLVEECDEHGVELIPWAGEVTFSCSCQPWADPCTHAIAVATQVGWLLDVDPFVLLTLRGTTREKLLAALHDLLTHAATTQNGPQHSLEGTDEVLDDLMIAEEAALRAERLLVELVELGDLAEPGS